MNKEVEIKQDFNDTSSNTTYILYNIIQKDVFPIEEINIKEESIEYANAEQKISSEAITFVQNVDSKAEFLEIEDCKIICNLNTKNFDNDFPSFIHHQLKCENDKMDIPLETEGVNNDNVYCLKGTFKFDCNDIPSDINPIGCNIAQKDVLPLPEIGDLSDFMKIEESKISYDLNSQNVGDQSSFIDHQFKSENDEMDCVPPESEVCDKKAVDNEKIYYCSRCVLKFDSELRYMLHLKTQHIVNTDNKLFNCNLCGIESKYKSSIERHMKTIHMTDKKYKPKPIETYTRKAEIFKCNLCEYESKHQSNIVSHVKNKHKVNKCPKCIYITDCKNELRKHATTHGVSENTDFKRFIRIAQNLYKCKLCEYECKHRSTMYRHILNKHDGPKEHECSQCEYRTRYMTEMKRHLLIHDDIRPYECEVCNKRFRLKHYLKDHSWTHLGEKRFQCLCCDYKNNQKSAIDIHMKNKHIKQEYKDYKCTQCPYETNNKTNLKRHVKQHLLGVEKEFKCGQCSYNTNFKSDLNMHVQNKHKQVKEYKCKQCKYETNYKIKMRQHILNHDTVKLYECSICNKLFKSNGSLKKHIRSIHLGVKEFQCAHCDYKTYKKFNLVVHVNTKHVRAQGKKYKRGKCKF